MKNLIENWNKVLNDVKEEHEISSVSFKTWLQPLQIFQITGDTVILIVPSGQMGIDYINRKYLLPLKVAIADYMEQEYEIQLILPEQASELMIQEEAPQKLPENDRERTLREMAERANLNPRYTFDTFVVGNNNKFAHAAALAVAETPGEIYNPLFIHGGAGLGKTHLMHSIAHFILEQNPSKKVLYVTSETFTNELIESIRNGNTTAMTKFREKYRSVDILLIDDIQFIIGKESTQEEFFHTFNDLHGRKKQIILSSDKPPKDIETLEARLRSRFEWGLIADIGLPDYETRMAILHRKEENDGYNIDTAVIEYIAMNIKSNIRELEGALNKLVALSHLEKRPITVELAQEALKDIVSPDNKKELTPQLILDTVAAHFHISVQDLCGSKRTSDIVYPRQIAMYLCLNMTGAGTKRIGIELGHRDHSTIIHGSRKIEKEINSNDSLRNTVEVLRKKLDPS